MKKHFVNQNENRRLNARGSQVHFDDFSGEVFFCFTIGCESKIT